MPINPAIALGVESPKPLDMLGAYGNAMSIKALVDGARLREQQGQALGQKMQFDAQDQALDLAGKRVKIGQQLASGLMSLPAEQRAAQYPTFRQNYIRLTGDANVPEQFDEGHVLQWALLGQDPNKMQEVIRADAQRMRMAELQRGQMGGSPQSSPEPAPTGAEIAMNPDGTASLTAPTVSVRGMVNPATQSSTYGGLLRSIMIDPQLAGTPYEKDARDAYLKMKTEEEVSPGRGVELRARPDGGVQRFRYGEQEGAVMPMGRDPTAEFWIGKDGQLIPNQALLDAREKRAKAGAANVSVEGSRVDLGKAAQNKVDEGLLDTSAALMRMDRIAKSYKPQWSEFSTQADMTGRAWLEKYANIQMDPKAKAEFKQYTTWRTGTLDNLTKGIKEATGSAMGVEEAKRIIASMPSPDDSPTEFKQKIDDAMAQYKMAMARFTYVKRQGGNMSIENVPLEKMPDIMRARDAELESETKRRFPNMNADERDTMIKRQLAQEFGLVYK